MESIDKIILLMKCFVEEIKYPLTCIEIRFDFVENKIVVVNETSLEWKMIDFVKIKVAVVNETSLEWKMRFRQHDAQIAIKFYYKFL